MNQQDISQLSTALTAFEQAHQQLQQRTEQLQALAQRLKEQYQAQYDGFSEAQQDSDKGIELNEFIDALDGVADDMQSVDVSVDFDTIKPFLTA